MIIVITNRQVFDHKITEQTNIEINKISDVLAPDNTDIGRILTGEYQAEAEVIKFYPKGKEKELFSSLISQGENKKRWVFFVHGFHQDPLENIKKAINIEKNHGVNVIVFAWPSHPVPLEMTKKEAVDDLKKNLLLGTLSYVSLLKLGVKAAFDFAYDKWVNYPLAQENAKKSETDLLDAMSLIRDYAKLESAPVLLVHSLGNYLIKNVLLNNKLPIKFSHIIHHQPDVNADPHHWILNSRKNLTANGNIYVSINIHDFVLYSSRKQKELRQLGNTERLGQTAFNFIVGKIKYIDFTYGEGVNEEHEFFNLSRKASNENVFDLLKRIFNGQSDELPTVNSDSSSGFTKMPTDISLYRLSRILDPVDDEVITPLDRFKNPLGEYDDEWND